MLDMLRGMAESAYLEESARCLSKRVSVHGDNRALMNILGLSVCRQLIQEAEGADEMPLQELFDDGALPVSDLPVRNIILSSAMKPHHWKKFIYTQMVDGWYEGRPRWSGGWLFASQGEPTEGLRGETRYKLARLVRKCTRHTVLQARQA